MSEPLDPASPDPDVTRHLEAARGELTSSLPRPDARIDAMVGAGPPPAGHPAPPAPRDPTVVLPTADAPERAGRGRRTVAVAAAALALVGIAAGIAVADGRGGDDTTDAAQAPAPDGVASAALVEEHDDDTASDVEPDGNDDAPALPDPLDDLLSENKEWLTCVSGEVHRFFEEGEPGEWSFGDLDLDACGSPPAFENPSAFVWPEDWDREDWGLHEWPPDEWDPEKWPGEWALDEWRESFELRFPPDFLGEWWGTEPGEADPGD